MPPSHDPTFIGSCSRREFIAVALATIAAARRGLAVADVAAGALGICEFSCHVAWQAARDGSAAVPFADATTFYDYARGIGADGVQGGAPRLDEATAAAFRDHVERTGGYFEAQLSLPRAEAQLARFEQEVKVARAAGATIGRAVLSGSRRYETWKTLEAFEAFKAAAPGRLAMVEPILKRHGLKLAVENHKDLTTEEFVPMLRQLGSEWVGVNVDTGNDLALLEDPYETVEALAPFAMTAHFKDMALQPHEKGFRLSEVRCGHGMLDLPRIVKTLRAANPAIRLNLEMATREPLVVPCLTDGYFVTFPQRKATHLAAAMARVAANPAREAPPSIAGKAAAQQVAEEDANNRESLRWMHGRLAG